MYCLPKLQGSKVACSLLRHKVWEIVLVDVHYYQVHEYECIHFWNETQMLCMQSTHLVLACRAGVTLIKCEQGFTSVLEGGSYAPFEPPLVTSLGWMPTSKCLRAPGGTYL